ncbi:phage tail protein, partial [Citrobacter portucalensis]|nr:phage tail protein [Citrobacter portucalensis]
MSAGTLTLTNRSAAVSGSGTVFTTELAAGDFIVVTVGGIPYTLPVKTINSNTSLTLVSNFTGPTQSGAAWSAVPRLALNMVTAALVAQSAEALRGLNYDKQNWQQVFSGTGNVTVKLPDGSSFTGPAWGGIVTILNGKAGAGANGDITSLSGLTTALSIAQGGTGAKIPRDAAVNLKTFLNGGTNIDRTTPT